jgi:hypothetical protein
VAIGRDRIKAIEQRWERGVFNFHGSKSNYLLDKLVILAYFRLYDKLFKKQSRLLVITEYTQSVLRLGNTN